MTDHSHDKVKAERTVKAVEFAFAPHHMTVTVEATITFATAGACVHGRSLNLHMIGTIVFEAAAGSDIPR